MLFVLSNPKSTSLFHSNCFSSSYLCDIQISYFFKPLKYCFEIFRAGLFPHTITFSGAVTSTIASTSRGTTQLLSSGAEIWKRCFLLTNSRYLDQSCRQVVEGLTITADRTINFGIVAAKRNKFYKYLYYVITLL